MAKLQLIYGKSGSGKTRSLLNFAENEILLINVEGKDLPFRKKFKYVGITDDVDSIKNWMKQTPTNVIVIDDAGYLLTNTFMRGHRKTTGNQVYELYNDIGDKYWGLFKFIKDEIPANKTVYILMHEETTDAGEVKLKTIGKLLDDKVCLEGMVTICLRCVTEEKKHYFLTKTDGTDITKSPEDMFATDRIENDLKAVDNIIREYYDLGPSMKSEVNKTIKSKNKEQENVA